KIRRDLENFLLTSNCKSCIIILAVEPLAYGNISCSSIEEVITSTTGNRVTVKSRPRVRIPPASPANPWKHWVSKAFSFPFADVGTVGKTPKIAILQHNGGKMVP